MPWSQRLELPILLPSVLLAAVMLWSVVQSVATSNWAEGLGLLVVVALPAFVVGLLFARIQWLPGWLAHSLSLVLGVVWSVQCIGPLLVNEIRGELGPALANRLVNWSDKASEILIRSVLLARTVQAGGRGEDIVLFIIALALLMWALGYATAWLLFRAHWAWAAVIINALVILVNYTFASPKPSTLFFVFLVAALLLVVHQNISQQQRRWASALIDYPEWMPARFLAAAALAIGAVALVTSLLPGNVSSAQVARTWRVVSSPFTAVREGWETAFSTINAPTGASGGGFFTRSMRVGGGRTLGSGLVMRVRSPLYDYWRAISRDRYTGRSWENTVGERARADVGTTTAEAARTEIAAGTIASDNFAIQGRTLVTQTVELAQDRSDNLLVMGGQFRSSGVPVLIEHGFVNGGTPLQPNYGETSAIFAQTPLQASNTYTVASLISTADVEGLRGAAQTYPDWIGQPYLQLPETLPQRVRDQAHAIVEQAKAATPYDKAVAIQNYLRTFTYDESRPAPPADRDWADYFIFDAKKGYCDDFATAMIVMLRAEGVPARLSQGYAGGTLDPQTGAYAVTESIAHSWPEAYFPGYGWQRFEPTPASYTNLPVRPETASANGSNPGTAGSFDLPAARDRDLSELDELQRGVGAQNTAALLEAQRQAQARQQLTLIIAMLTVIGGALGYAYYLLNRNLHNLSPAAAAYARMTRLATWAGVRQEEHQTPYEYSSSLAAALPVERDTISQIVDGYVRESYQGANPSPQVDYNAAWQQLRRPLLVHMVTQLFTRRTPKPAAAKAKR